MRETIDAWLPAIAILSFVFCVLVVAHCRRVTDKKREEEQDK